MPIVVLTSSQQESDRYQSYVWGVNAYVVKPVEFDAFSEAVKQLGLFWLVVNEPPPDRESPDECTTNRRSVLIVDQSENAKSSLPRDLRPLRRQRSRDAMEADANWLERDESVPPEE